MSCNTNQGENRIGFSNYTNKPTDELNVEHYSMLLERIQNINKVRITKQSAQIYKLYYC